SVYGDLVFAGCEVRCRCGVLTEDELDPLARQEEMRRLPLEAVAGVSSTVLECCGSTAECRFGCEVGEAVTLELVRRRSERDRIPGAHRAHVTDQGRDEVSVGGGQLGCQSAGRAAGAAVASEVAQRDRGEQGALAVGSSAVRLDGELLS